VCGLSTTMLLKPSIGCGYRTLGDVVGHARGTEIPAHFDLALGPEAALFILRVPPRGVSRHQVWKNAVMSSSVSTAISELA
jgi:hypothetical protein